MVFSIPDDLQSSEKETTINKCINASSLSPVNENIEALQNPSREVLSPIHSNIGRSHIVSSDPKTPKLRAVACDEENNISKYGTPLDIITARSSRLKVLPHFSLMICLLCLLCWLDIMYFVDRLLFSRITLNSWIQLAGNLLFLYFEYTFSYS